MSSLKTIVLFVVISQLWVHSSAQEDEPLGLTNRTGRVGDFSKKIIVDFNNLPGKRRPDGKRCVPKKVLIHEIVYDRGMECHHRIKEKCHLSYVTDYHSVPEEKCETNYKKDCHIGFKPVSHVEKVKKCHTPYEKKCGTGFRGKKICKTVYENSCETKYEEYELDEDRPVCDIEEKLNCKKKNFNLLHLPHKDGDKPFAVQELCEKWPVKKCKIEKNKTKKIHPKTDCEKVPRKVCHESNCEMVPGKEICYEDEVVKVQQVPEEECDLEPHKVCKTESVLVPKLIPKKNCIKVPKEICVNTKKNPRKVPKIVIKDWCYNPDEFKKFQ